LKLANFCNCFAVRGGKVQEIFASMIGRELFIGKLTGGKECPSYFIGNIMATKSHRVWSREQVSFLSDVIATGVCEESSAVQECKGPTEAEGELKSTIETTFLVSHTFKGKVPEGAKVVVRHYCSAGPNEGAPTEPVQASKGQTYLLFLRSNGQDSFEPTSGALDPSISICNRET
jgi:hypothetical protein